MGKIEVKFLILIIFLSFPLNASAEVWSASCASAIDDLKRSQHEVSTAYEKYDTARLNLEIEKRILDFCLGDCRREQEMVNRRAKDFNDSLKELKNYLSDFESALKSFQSQCLRGKPQG
jgi:hypothetical protein